MICNHILSFSSVSIEHAISSIKERYPDMPIMVLRSYCYNKTQRIKYVIVRDLSK